MRHFHISGLIVLLLIITGCVLTRSISSRQETASHIALNAGFNPRVIDAGTFDIQTWYRQANSAQGHLEIYIEGDGLAWRRKNRLSKNPTPVEPLTLRLAARVSTGPVLYLARPCQYTRDIQTQRCSPELWSSHRYSEPVVAAMNRTVDEYVRTTGAETITLVGYSGGGVIATLLAARRTDVEQLITVAANLDHAAWTTKHNVSPLTGSLNPASYPEALQQIPQIHFVGDKDRVVSADIVRSYLDKVGIPADSGLRIVPGFDHDCCWVERWSQLRQEVLLVRK